MVDASEQVKWDSDGLAPGIVQDARTGDVRMLGYLNPESLRLTVETGEVHFYSRSRNRLWKKGETSGNVLRLVEARVDCDGDTLLLRVIPTGPTCHTGEETCFFADPIATGERDPASARVIDEIAGTIASRHAEMPEGSYTTYLFQEGIDKIGKKIGEEAAEVIIAAKNGEPEPLAGEAADLLYHLLVMLQASGVTPESVWDTLQQRHGQPSRRAR
ncbi:MAG TPA: bifunctional phosphoribosyl-AMP cyclohydrolase/phosphoribosyl-ATP diphosphatase HisIE [Thermomicrobiales bacterium]|nr:bifunctional phosphoribosyl-AMP cyclohydrolase/phosphoribosyl-ATP diphosphatase HisIE [Thermomicrobiales bacterium]